MTCNSPLMTPRQCAEFVARYDWVPLRLPEDANLLLTAGYLRNYGITARISRRAPISMFGIGPRITLLVDAQQEGSALELLRELSVRYGDFTLASGRKSRYFIDGKLTTMHPEGAYLAARLFLDLLEGTGVEALGGPTLGADPIAGAVAAVSFQLGRPLPTFIVRKEAKDHGTGRRVEGPPLRPGAPVALVEDVCSTGGSALAAADAVEADSGSRVVVVLCLVDRDMGAAAAFRARGLDYRPLFPRDAVVDPSRL